MPPEATPSADPDAALVVWRGHVLMEAGVGPETALRLAEARRADLHAMVEAKEGGCPDKLLLQIFL